MSDRKVKLFTGWGGYKMMEEAMDKLELTKTIGDLLFKKHEDKKIKENNFWISSKQYKTMLNEAMRKEIGEKLELNKKETMATYAEHIATEEALKIANTMDQKEFYELLLKGYGETHISEQPISKLPLTGNVYTSNKLNSDGYAYNIKAGSTGDLECFPDSVTYNNLMTKEEIKEKYPLESYSMQMVDLTQPVVDPSDTYTYNGYHGMVKNAMGDFVEVDFESFLDYKKDYKITTSKMIGEAVLYGTKNNITRSIKLYNGSVNPRYFIDFRICNQE